MKYLLPKKSSAILPSNIIKVTDAKRQHTRDNLSVEEPLEIILDFPERKRLTLAITMRTPGNDKELVAGFLFSEGLVKNNSGLLDLSQDTESANPGNTIVARIGSPLSMAPDQLQRHFFTNSSCGVCGKTSMQALELLHQPALIPGQPGITATLLQQLPELLRAQQQQFSATGGVHSVAAFSTEGTLLALHEDVGRHNAMDKLLGGLLLEDRLPLLKNSVLLVSGRSSFELVQKALMADAPILASIGAPSSLAVQLADRHGMTLAGFLKPDGFNVYSGVERIIKTR